MASKPKLGDLVEVTWLDTTAYTNRHINDVKLSKAINIGGLVRFSRKEIVLQTGTYPEDKPADRLGDFTIIPRAWTDKIKVLKRGRK